MAIVAASATHTRTGEQMPTRRSDWVRVLLHSLVGQGDECAFLNEHERSPGLVTRRATSVGKESRDPDKDAKLDRIVVRRRKGGDHTLAALKSIRAARPDGAPIYVILDNLSANKTPAIRAWAARHKMKLCFTPTSASWANPIEARFGPLRTFVMGNSDHESHPALTRRLHAYLRWRNANARHPDVLAAQRRERARIRSERQ
jgi:hypothetical protein